MRIQRWIAIFTFAMIQVTALCYTKGDEVSLIPAAGGYPTGASMNALAGPLFASDLKTKAIAGDGMETVSAALSGNFATHATEVALDFSSGPGYFLSEYSSPFSRTSTLDHRASAESVYHFAVDVETEYAMEGFFSVTDDAGTMTPGNVELEIELLEFDSFEPGSPPPETVYYSYQGSKSTIDQGFVVGAMDGDTTNELIGMPVGILMPGKFYRYRTLVTMNAIDIDGGGILPATDGGASAVGEHAIVFSTVSVPEPFSGCLLPMLGMAFVCRRRRADSQTA